ncbi:DUF1493 family protein [Acidovorax sp. GBBC 3334]|uniref:DUF1493 family protein n=1 Tax=Acidovorax sp. GBBC 3334 TaxID=2940496 RepID=UPI0023040A26|nr:DUF1493 family protein [Acidovorax sp. GBBC 3334]MDA8454945.1 DUF1493 family protein [Acidovorax sp. GBBC 3334]
MVAASSELWRELVELASGVDSMGFRHIGKKIEYTPHTDLVKDLGLTGDDAFDFMEKFASKFTVEKGDYSSSDYFGPEGLNIFSFFKKDKPTMPITLGMLFLAARSGIWNRERLQQAYNHQNYE